MRPHAVTRLLRSRTPEPAEPVPDRELLARFVQSGAQAAFELLVWRHAVMVAGVCRRLVRDEHLADDAFQAVFLVLARKAGSVRGENLAGWLFRVARRVSLRARKQAAVQSRREAPLTADPARPPEPHPAEAREQLAILDEEVNRLPERFRLPVLLCYLGGRTTDEAAQLLGCPRGTILSRLATARQRLASRLTRRGVVPSLGVAGVGGMAPDLAAVGTLIPPTVRLAAAFCLRTAALDSPRPVPVLLAEGVLNAMSISKAVVIAGLFVVAAGLVSGLGLVTAQTPTERPSSAAAAQPPEKASPQPPAPKAPPTAEETRRAQVEQRIKILENMVTKLRDELFAKERSIRLMAEANSNAAGTDPARLNDRLGKLENEISQMEIDGVRVEVEIGRLKEQLKDEKFSVAEAVLEKAVEADQTAAIARFKMTKAQVELEKARTAAGNPPIQELTDKAQQTTKEYVRERDRVQGGVIAAAKIEAKVRLAELEEKQAVSRGILAVLIRRRDDLQIKVLQLAKGGRFDLQQLLNDLAPLRAAVQKLEAELLQLRIERDIPPTPGSAPVGLDAKMDVLLKEIVELRREVRELRKP